MAGHAARQNWFFSNRIALIAVATILLYVAFVQWIWGWGQIAAGWRDVGTWTILAALTLLVGTYVIRTHRIQDYFPGATQGRFWWLFRVTQIHNLLNIMLPFRAGETSFPLLMRSEFGVPLAQGTAALMVLRLLDLHALMAAGGVGLVAGTGYELWAWAAWMLFLFFPLVLFPLRNPVIALVRRTLPEKLGRFADQIADGIPQDSAAFVRAWGLTALNWGVKIVVLAWVLRLMGIDPLAACFGGALGGELSSVLPVHAPGGVGTYPAGIAAGAVALGADKHVAALDLLAKAGINLHLLVTVSAVTGTGISLLVPTRKRTLHK